VSATDTYTAAAAAAAAALDDGPNGYGGYGKKRML
jgi:hypothetical protein